MFGKEKCRILKEIRQRIADENDIPYVTRECGYQGECKGTCPRCESELQYLERELARRKSLGKRVSVAALCVGMSLAAAGCSPTEKTVEKVEVEIQNNDLTGAAVVDKATPTPDPNSDIVFLDGEVAYIDESDNDYSDEVYVTEGEYALPDEECDTSSKIS